ncbi:pilus assembly protein N-terminal domain-containing protein [Methylobacterium sp. A54F]
MRSLHPILPAPGALLARLAVALCVAVLPCALRAEVREAPRETPREATVVTVMVDNAKVIRLPEKSATVIVGNPLIADVTLQKNGVLVLTGKSFGTTNLIALDAAGTMLAESMIRVEAPQAAVITVQRGLERESYSCTPNCQPSMQLGDARTYFDAVSSQADQRRKLATSGTGAER